jgi:hypothetical protein
MTDQETKHTRHGLVMQAGEASIKLMNARNEVYKKMEAYIKRLAQHDAHPFWRSPGGPAARELLAAFEARDEAEREESAAQDALAKARAP